MGKFQTKKGRILEAELSRYMILARIKSKDALRAHTTIGSNVTMLKYMDNPDAMPLGNLIEIMSALKIPTEEKLHIMEQMLEIK